MGTRGAVMTGRRKSTIIGQFVPHRIELIESPAWRVLSLSARRVLDRIEVELCHHGGLRENGRLPVTYGDFERYGIHCAAIAPAIREVVALVPPSGSCDSALREGTKVV
jgi:hypothetical protein